MKLETGNLKWIGLFCLIGQACFGGDLRLWYDKPASEWVESLPVGNGRLLATNRGGVQRETIQMNEDTLWSGRPVERDNPEGAEYLAEVRTCCLPASTGRRRSWPRKK